MCATEIISAIGDFDNIEELNFLLPKRLIKFLQSNYVIAKNIGEHLFLNKVVRYSENPFNFPLHSLSHIINLLTNRENFQVCLNYALIFHHIPRELCVKNNSRTLTYRYCLECTHFILPKKPNFHCSFRPNSIESFHPTRFNKYEILIDLLCSNCYNLLFDRIITIFPQPWLTTRRL